MKRIDANAVLIAGPTASGKSQLALALAEEIGGAIINADSMQVYREPRILTARPLEDEMHRVLHLLYGHVGVREPYSVGRYVRDAARALAQVRGAGRVPVFVGGTGMYFGVLTEGIANIPPVPSEVRAAAEALHAQIGADAFYAELAAHDPESAARLRPSDKQRTLRAFEVVEATGRPLSQWQREMGSPILAGLRLQRMVLAPPRQVLYAHIDSRFERMVEQGALAEAASLAGLPAGLPAAKILGLRELLAVHAGSMSLEEAKAAAKQATRRYAKRQLTWLRHRMADWQWSDAVEMSAMIR